MRIADGRRVAGEVNGTYTTRHTCGIVSDELINVDFPLMLAGSHGERRLSMFSEIDARG